MAFPVSASLLDAIVLAVVAREGTYGYKITQDVRQVMEVSDSTLYPVLRRLQRDGLLATYDEAVDGRMRRYYRITPAGEVRLAQYRMEWAEYRKNIEQVLFE
ncbi:MAG: helix-turn-helix transcriptional regulator [Butyricicoccus sp.]|nr:helix-turn-helix transcriptional regulator [Butyricicoccus sp.]MBQ8585757.1 helix-turn-helix transcriptional regulator [Butyricicoccus sp.]